MALNTVLVATFKSFLLDISEYTIVTDFVPSRGVELPAYFIFIFAVHFSSLVIVLEADR